MKGSRVRDNDRKGNLIEVFVPYLQANDHQMPRALLGSSGASSSTLAARCRSVQAAGTGRALPEEHELQKCLASWFGAWEVCKGTCSLFLEWNSG